MTNDDDRPVIHLTPDDASELLDCLVECAELVDQCCYTNEGQDAVDRARRLINRLLPR